MDIKVPYSKITNKTEGYEAAKKLIPDVIAKFGVKADVKNHDGSTTIDAKGTGFGAKIEFKDSEAVVSVDLSFLLKPLKGKILETIEKQIKKIV
jgi:hypothetical protein